MGRFLLRWNQPQPLSSAGSSCIFTTLNSPKCELILRRSALDAYKENDDCQQDSPSRRGTTLQVVICKVSPKLNKRATPPFTAPEKLSRPFKAHFPTIKAEPHMTCPAHYMAAESARETVNASCSSAASAPMARQRILRSAEMYDELPNPAHCAMSLTGIATELSVFLIACTIGPRP